MNANDPASPCPVSMGPNGETCFTQYNGLTKRELIAAMVMQGYAAIPDDRHASKGCTESESKAYRAGWMAADAKYCVELTDALILELSKEQPK